jgi:hypothetical protein
MAQQIQLRNDSTAGWSSENPILAQGEIGIDTTLSQMKIGDGTTAWNDLEFYIGGSGGSNEITPLPDFLEYFTGREHLPVLNSNFGWDSNGLWFGNALSADGPYSLQSYPVCTDGVFQEFDKVVVTFDMQIDDYCSDLGVCVYPTTETPNWFYGTDGTRIAAQFNCTDPVIHGMSSTAGDESGADNIPDPGTYRVRFTYDPNASTEKVVFELLVQDGNQFDQISRLTLNEQFELNGGTYKIGFASDNSANDENIQNPPYITYMSNLTIDVNDGETTYTDSLQNGYSGQILNLVVPLTFIDVEGNDLLRIEKGYTGVTRIDALQDDLALRSSRDIILYPGDDGAGEVYIGWGNASTTPNATNRVATLADIENSPKEYTANNDARYGTYQASGFVEVTSNAATNFTAQVYSPDFTANSVSVTILVDQTANDLFATNPSWREITINDDNDTTRVLRNPSSQGPTEGGFLWSFGCDGTLVLDTGTAYTVSGSYGGAPILWWDADNENPTGEEFSNSNFRGAKIEYHAYVSDGGTVIGTIYIADDSNDRNVTHIETASGGNDSGTAIFWNRSGSETELYLYRTDGEGILHKIQWTAQMYYATEVYDD